MRVCKQMLTAKHMWTVAIRHLGGGPTTMTYPGGEVLTVSTPLPDKDGLQFRATCSVSVLYQVRLRVHLTADECRVALGAHREICDPFLLSTTKTWLSVLSHIVRLTVCHIKQRLTDKHHDPSDIDLLFEDIRVEGEGLPFKTNPFTVKRQLKPVFVVDTFVKGLGRKRSFHARLKLVDLARDFARNADGGWVALSRSSTASGMLHVERKHTLVFTCDDHPLLRIPTSRLLRELGRMRYGARGTFVTYRSPGCEDAAHCLGYIKAVTETCLHHEDNPFKLALHALGHCSIKADPAPLSTLAIPLLRAAAVAHAIPTPSGHRHWKQAIVRELTSLCLKADAVLEDGVIRCRAGGPPLDKHAAATLLEVLLPGRKRPRNPQRRLSDFFSTHVKPLNLESSDDVSDGGDAAQLSSLHQDILQVQLSLESGGGTHDRQKRLKDSGVAY